MAQMILPDLEVEKPLQLFNAILNFDFDEKILMTEFKKNALKLMKTKLQVLRPIEISKPSKFYNTISSKEINEDYVETVESIFRLNCQKNFFHTNKQGYNLKFLGWLIHERPIKSMVKIFRKLSSTRINKPLLIYFGFALAVQIRVLTMLGDKMQDIEVNVNKTIDYGINTGILNRLIDQMDHYTIELLKRTKHVKKAANLKLEIVQKHAILNDISLTDNKTLQLMKIKREIFDKVNLVYVRNPSNENIITIKKLLEKKLDQEELKNLKKRAFFLSNEFDISCKNFKQLIKSQLDNFKVADDKGKNNSQILVNHNTEEFKKMKNEQYEQEENERVKNLAVSEELNNIQIKKTLGNEVQIRKIDQELTNDHNKIGKNYIDMVSGKNVNDDSNLEKILRLREMIDNNNKANMRILQSIAERGYLFSLGINLKYSTKMKNYLKERYAEMEKKRTLNDFEIYKLMDSILIKKYKMNGLPKRHGDKYNSDLVKFLHNLKSGPINCEERQMVEIIIEGIFMKTTLNLLMKQDKLINKLKENLSLLEKPCNKNNLQATKLNERIKPVVKFSKIDEIQLTRLKFKARFINQNVILNHKKQQFVERRMFQNQTAIKPLTSSTPSFKLD